MSVTVASATDVDPGVGPHPAGSPFDRRLSEALGLTGFEVYEVDLPPGADTVDHDHLEDDTEDMYAILRGSGWLVVDGVDTPVAPGQYIAVTQGHRRHLRAGPDGLDLIAVCAPTRRGL